MKTLLRIDCSARSQGSHSRKLADYFEKNWKMANPNGKVIYRDLAKEQIPHINSKTIEGFYTPSNLLTNETKQATALSDQLIGELKNANEILISSPLYNLSTPSNLKAYIDQVVRIGHTFNTNEEGYYGLLKNKISYLITVKGGVYKNTPMEQYDFQDHYLQAILGFMGINTKEIFSLEGAADEEMLEKNMLVVQKNINLSLKNVNK